MVDKTREIIESSNKLGQGVLGPVACKSGVLAALILYVRA